MDKQPSIKILSTRHLSSEVLLKGQRWNIEVCNLIETNGILSTEAAYAFVESIENDVEPTMLIFTSTNGVKWLKRGLENINYHLPHGMTVLVVGNKTAARVAEQLKAIPFLIAHHGSDLLKLIREHIPTHTRLIYPCSKTRLDTLPDGLKEAGYSVEEVPVYKTVEVPVQIQGTYDFILFFSPSAVDAFFRLNKWNTETTGVCIGNTTADALKQRGVGNILVADAPDEMEMLEAIEQFINKG
jgi:uroporphyrinogen-III synthase